MNILKNFEEIISQAKEKGLCDDFFISSKEHIDTVSGLLKTSPVQTVIFSLILEHFGEYSVSLDELAGSLKCQKIQLIKYMDDLDELKFKKLIRETSSSKNPFTDNRVDYTIPLVVIDAIRKGIEYKPKPVENLTPVDFFDYADDLFSALKDDDIDKGLFNQEIELLFEYNKENSFVKKQRAYNLDNSSMIIMLNLCCDHVSRDQDKTDMDDLSQYVGNQYYRYFKRGIKSQEHELIVKNLIEFECQKGFVNTDYCFLSKKAKDEFLADINLCVAKKQKSKELIPVEKISVKHLFYSAKIRDNIEELGILLNVDNFNNVQKRLSENGMRTGFACIFSGPPGTGKTETVYQIAHKTGRDIMLVDISETKSMWFGESEKLIKGVFDRYKSFVENEEVIPILLFNEADAVLGKRREFGNSQSGPDQTENAIQNIILQEMENLNGILIATTNMTANLDNAFERRFLYKIEFDKPDIESKRKIWQSNIHSLGDEEAAQLSEQFDFSGGQIENIARKSTVFQILKGTTPALSDLLKLCREETLQQKTNTRIGFQVS